jgi:hypothetical protein
MPNVTDVVETSTRNLSVSYSHACTYLHRDPVLILNVFKAYVIEWFAIREPQNFQIWLEC